MKYVNQYRIWYRCLKLSRPSRWTNDVKDRFLPVQHAATFEEWLQGLLEEFKQQEHYYAIPLEDMSDFEHHKEHVWQEDGLVVLLNLNEPKTALLAAVKELLDQRHPGKPGRPPFEDWAETAMKGRVNVTAARFALDVWELKNQKQTPKLKLWEIAKKLKINREAIPKHGEPDHLQKAVLSAQVSRYYKFADTLIKGVEKGIFPAR
jgi:hypothetical protein